MGFNKKQKKYIRKNLRKMTVDEIAGSLGINIIEVQKYLQKHLNQNKYKWLASKEPKSAVTKKNISLNLKAFIVKNRWRLLILATLIFVVYVNSLSNEFLSDDIDGILRNPNIGKLKSALDNPFNFVNSLVYYLVYKVFGLVPTAFRSVNILFHLGTTTLIFSLLCLLTNPNLAMITASIFAVHPVLTESVSWISSGYYIFSSFFALLSFILYILSDRKGSKNFYIASIILFALTLAASQKNIGFPAIFFLYELSYGNLKKNWLRLLPFFGLSAFWGINLVVPFQQRVEILEKNYYQTPNERSNPFYQIPIAIASYFQLIFWPQALTLYHSEMNFNWNQYVVMLIVFLIYISISISTFFKARHISFWLSWFIICLSPTLLPFGISWIVAERYVYLASLGIFVVIGIVFDRLVKNKKTSPYAIVAFCLVVVTLGIRTIARNIDWKNQDNLWLSAAKYSPTSPQNHNNLGDLYSRHENLEKAEEEFQTAIALKPNYADAFHNLGNTYLKMQRINEAIENYQKALSINPNLWQSHQTLAAIYFQQNEFAKSQKEVERALEINPNEPQLHTNLAIVYAKIGNLKEAEAELQKSLSLNPDNPRARELLQQLLETSK